MAGRSAPASCSRHRGTARADDLPGGQQLTGVFEQQYAVAQEGPALLWPLRDGLCGLTVCCGERGAVGFMLAHSVLVFEAPSPTRERGQLGPYKEELLGRRRLPRGSGAALRGKAVVGSAVEESALAVGQVVGQGLAPFHGPVVPCVRARDEADADMRKTGAIHQGRADRQGHVCGASVYVSAAAPAAHGYGEQRSPEETDGDTGFEQVLIVQAGGHELVVVGSFDRQEGDGRGAGFNYLGASSRGIAVEEYVEEVLGDAAQGTEVAEGQGQVCRSRRAAQ